MRKTLLAAVIALGSTVPAAYAQTTLYGITNANAIFSISDVSSPSSVSGPYSISGVASGQALIGLGFRPDNGRLYALGYDSLASMAELYTISNSGTTYTATPVTGTLASMNLGLTNNAAVNFVSTADNEIRVVGRNGNNYLMNANDGTVMSTGTSGLSFAAGDLHVGTGIMAATAYTNNFYGSDMTNEVGYDAANNVLVSFDNANFSNGFNVATNTMHSIGSGIGTTLLTTGSVGMTTWFDTLSHNNTIYLTGNTLLSGAHLYRYTMGSLTGTITDMGAIGSGSLNVRAISFQSSRDTTSAVTGHLLTGLSLNMRNLVYFDSRNPGKIRNVVALNGMTAGQRMIGIDYSGNGRLYGLGYNSGTQTYQLYTIDSVSGHVTAVNTTPATLNLGSDDGSGNFINAGMRFIATDTSRIRVIGNNGNTNVAISAATGTVVATDNMLRYIAGDVSFGASANLTSMAYTGYPGDTATQMFGFDANTGNMVSFDNANSSTGFGNGSSGYINTGLSLNSILSLLGHTSAYNNSYINIAYDPATLNNVGFMAANYGGDSSNLLDYATLYDMSDMLTGYHRGTSSAPVETGRIGYGTPVKDITLRRGALPASTGFSAGNFSGSNDLLVYPNPVVSNTHIVMPFVVQSPINVDVVDMNGNINRSYQFPAGTSTLDVDMSSLPTGLYSVRVTGKYITSHNLKVVKE